MPVAANVYAWPMHGFQRCAAPGCGNLSFQGSSLCLAHHPDPAAAQAEIAALLASERGAKDLNAAGISSTALISPGGSSSAAPS